MTEKRHRTGENSGKNAEKTAVRVARRCVRLRQGGEAALCVLDTGDAPERERDSLTSMGAGVVLSSTAVRLGEHGTVHELAEGELFRWAIYAALTSCALRTRSRSAPGSAWCICG